MQALCKNNAGTPYTYWVPYNRMPYETLGSGWDANNVHICESGIPDGRQAVPGALVYKQVDVRTFGVTEKLNLLQSRPPLYFNAFSLILCY